MSDSLGAGRSLIEVGDARYVRLDLVDAIVVERNELRDRVAGLESVTRCNDPMPNGDGMQLCDRWPDHDGPHYNAEGLQWRQR